MYTLAFSVGKQTALLTVMSCGGKLVYWLKNKHISLKSFWNAKRNIVFAGKHRFCYFKMHCYVFVIGMLEVLNEMQKNT